MRITHAPEYLFGAHVQIPRSKNGRTDTSTLRFIYIDNHSIAQTQLFSTQVNSLSSFSMFVFETKTVMN